jgi:hypothetical protein
MKRIDHSTATEADQFTEGNPSSGVPPTVVTADWLNGIQEEIVAVIEEAGITLDGADQTQLLQAINAMLAISTTEARGIVELATIAETILGTDMERAVTPAGLLAAMSGVDTRDRLARRGVILNAFRLAQAADVQSGDLVEGFEWLCEDTSLLALTDFFFDGSGPYLANQTPTLYANPLGSGDRTAQIAVTRNWSYGGNGGDITHAVQDHDNPLSSGFTIAGGPVAGLFINFDFGSPQYISEVTLYSVAQDGTWKWQYSDDNAAWADVPDSTFTKGAITPAHTIPLADMGAHRYWRALGVSGSSTANWWSGFDFKILDGASRVTLDGEVEPLAAQVAATAPDDVSLYMLHTGVDTVTPGTDLRAWASRDGGTTWTEGSLSEVASLDGTISLLQAEADLSGQPSGTDMTWKITTANLKSQRIFGIALQWG